MPRSPVDRLRKAKTGPTEPQSAADGASSPNRPPTKSWRSATKRQPRRPKCDDGEPIASSGSTRVRARLKPARRPASAQCPRQGSGARCSDRPVAVPLPSGRLRPAVAERRASQRMALRTHTARSSGALCEVLATERRSAGEEVVEGGAEAEDVACWAKLVEVAAGLFGAHVTGRADRRAGPRTLDSTAGRGP